MIKLDKEIIDLLHNDREISFRYDLLDFNENKIGELESLDGNISMNSLAEIKRTGKLVVKENEFKDVNWLNDRVQPIFILNGKYEFPLGVFLISSPTRTINNNEIHRHLEVYDTSLILKEDKFEKRYIIPKNANYITVITQLLNSANILKYDIPDLNYRLKVDKEYEIGTNKLEAINDLLSEINYTSLWVDELGVFTSKPYILPTDRDVEYEYRNNDLSIIYKNSTTEEVDLFSVPNKFIVVATNPESEVMTSRYTNSNINSPTSTVNRRRNIVNYRQISNIANQAVLEQYIRRIAYEESNVFSKFVFDTALMPHHSFSDALYIEHSDLKINDKYIETNWNMELKYNGKMRHSARRVIQI